MMYCNPKKGLKQPDRLPKYYVREEEATRGCRVPENHPVSGRRWNVNHFYKCTTVIELNEAAKYKVEHSMLFELVYQHKEEGNIIGQIQNFTIVTIRWR